MGLLRLLLAVCVFCGHSRRLGNFRWLEGHLAVELFFVVSGFYMQLVLSQRYTKRKLGSTWRFQFYKARYLRLLPIYLLGSFLALGTAFLLTGFPPFPVLSRIWALPATLEICSLKPFSVSPMRPCFFRMSQCF